KGIPILFSCFSLFQVLLFSHIFGSDRICSCRGSSAVSVVLAELARGSIGVAGFGTQGLSPFRVGVLFTLEIARLVHSGQSVHWGYRVDIVPGLKCSA